MERFDVATLQELAGERVFARGNDYHRDGNVRILALETGRVLAQVDGTETYRTEVTGRDRKIGGACTCPAYRDWGICKHMVATALAANASAGEGDDKGVGALARIREHLKTQSVQALVDMVIRQAERDPRLLAKLEMAATVKGTDAKTLSKQIRKMLDRVTRVGDYVEYPEVAEWAEEVDLVLDAVSDLVGTGNASAALDLACHAIDRIEGALDNIDDSNGDCIALLERARDIHLSAATAARPDPRELARDLFRRELGGQFETFHGSAALYADVLGEEGLAEFRGLAWDAWERHPPKTARSGGASVFNPAIEQLAVMLDFFAKREGDVELRIALRCKDLSSSGRYFSLVNFCLSLGRQQDALRWAEEGLWVFEDGPPDLRLVRMTADLFSQAGRGEDAERLLQRAFAKAPSLAAYISWKKLGGAPVLKAAVEMLERSATGQGRGLSAFSYSTDLLVQLFTHEKQMDDAWNAIRRHEITSSTAMELARASEATHPADAIGVYSARVDQLVQEGGASAYAEAVSLVGRMASLQGAAEQAKLVATLKERFRRKRNFMKLLA